MTIDVYGSKAGVRYIAPARSEGNVQGVDATETLDALAEDEVLAMVRIPAHTRVRRLSYVNAAMGANTALQFGYESVDGSPSELDAFATVAAAATAGGGDASFAPITFTEDTYLTVTNTGTGDASGAVSLVVDYIWVGA